MPRSGPPTYTYTLPPIYLAIPGTTITAAQHNEPLEDIAATFNTIQPIVWGGTGAGTEAGARGALGVPGLATANTFTANQAIANSAAASALSLQEDPANGTSKVSVSAPSSLAADRVQTLQDITGTLYVTGGTDVAVADGGTGLSSYTVGDILYASAATTLSKLGKGTAGQVLTQNAALTAPEWTAAPGMKLLASGSASGATLDIVLTAYTAYRGIVIELINMIPATDSVTLRMRVSTNGGSSYDAGASDYKYTMVSTVTTDPTAYGNNQSSSASYIQVSDNDIGSGASEGVNVTVKIVGQANAAIKPKVRFETAGYNATDFLNQASGAGLRNNAQDTDAVRFLFSSGNITSGTYAVYGLA